MFDFCQGDIVKISGFQCKFLIISKNAFIEKTNVIHVCPLLEHHPAGPLHIYVEGKQQTSGVVICEQIKLIDPSVRICSKVDRIPYDNIMNISDAIQGIFEYD